MSSPTVLRDCRPRESPQSFAAPPARQARASARAMSPLSFDQSGSGAVAVGVLALQEVQQLCCDCGFVKAGAAADKPLAQRADTSAFFKVLGVNSLTAFRELFYNSRVAQPKPGQAPPPPPKKAAATAAPSVRAARALPAGAAKTCIIPPLAMHAVMLQLTRDTSRRNRAAAPR